MQNEIIHLQSKFLKLLYGINQFVRNNKQIIKKHILGWTIYCLIEFCFSVSIAAIIPSSFIKNIVYFILCFYAILFGAFIPQLPKKILKAIIVSFFLVILLVAFKYFFDFYIYKINFPKDKSILKNYFAYEIWRIYQPTIYAYAYWVYLNSIKDQKLRREAEKKLLKTEIDFLKAQINPHFVFNTLNFVYNKVASIDKESGEAIMSLTRLMRNSVESTKHEQATIASEVNMIEEYLYLQKLRFGKRLCVEFKKEGLFSFFAIPPLILISLVENAFKYGIIDDAENPIYISIKVDKDALYFVCKNKKRVDFEDKETTAIGLGNIKRRLEIYYDHNYDLYANETIDIYEVFLNIRWKK
jgi:two-component system, LytTR family, sensor kinase